MVVRYSWREAENKFHAGDKRKSKRVEVCMQDIFLVLQTAILPAAATPANRLLQPHIQKMFSYWRINQIAKSKEQIAVVREFRTYAKGGQQNNKKIQNFNWMTITMWLRTSEIRIHNRIHSNKHCVAVLFGQSVHFRHKRHIRSECS